MSDAAFRVGGRPFGLARLRQLVGYVRRVAGHCNHDHRHTFAWACVERFAPWLLLELFGYYDGLGCDCEVAQNAEAVLLDGVGLKRLPPAAAARERSAAAPSWSLRLLRAGSPSQRAAFGLRRERPN